MRKRNAVTVAIAILLSFLPRCVRAADVAVNPSGPVLSINGLTWGCSGSNCFNNNYWFSPLYPSGSVCVYVYNNNPTNPHQFTAQITYSGDPNATAPSNGTWSAYNTPLTITAFTSLSTPGIIGASTSGAVLVSINFSASIAQGGSPDTANVRIVQTTNPNGNCLVTLSSSASGSSATRPIQVNSDVFASSFVVSAGPTNPASGAAVFLLINNQPTGQLKSIYLDHIVITSTASVTVTINAISTLGTACGFVNGAILNLRVTSGNTSVAQDSAGPCTVNPAALNPITTALIIPANTPISYDLTGIVLPSSTVNNPGIDVVVNAALTGTINTTCFWYER